MFNKSIGTCTFKLYPSLLIPVTVHPSFSFTGFNGLMKGEWHVYAHCKPSCTLYYTCTYIAIYIL